MASIFSTLSLEDQAARLCEFVSARGKSLSEVASLTVCRSVELRNPCESKQAARLLIAALAAHDVVLRYSIALEALAHLCGQSNWMRVLQAEKTAAADDAVFYALRAVKDGDAQSFEIFDSMSEAADRLLRIVSDRWPASSSVSMATLGFGPQMLVVELEHETAPWLQLTVARFAGREGDSDIDDVPATEARAFCERVTRALEYSHPGLLVLNSLRSTSLAPEYYLCLEVLRVNTGDKLTCHGDLEWMPVLDSLRPTPDAETVGEVLRFDSASGPIEVGPFWTSNADERLVRGGLTASQLNGLIKRLDRLRRITGTNATQHLARVMTGAASADNFFPVNKAALDEAMQEANFSPKQVALLAQVPVNVVQRVLKYSFAHESVLPKLTYAVGLDHPNALVPPETDRMTGVHIEDGAAFLHGLKETHIWRRIMGDSLQGQDAGRVSEIGEALQEYVEILQFRTGSFADQLANLKAFEPADEASLAQDIQELLDELKHMGVAVVVSTSIRYGHGKGRLKDMEGMPLHHGTLFFEKLAVLQPAPNRVG